MHEFGYAQEQSNVLNGHRILRVTGKGVIETESDVAQVTLTVVTRDESLSISQSTNAETMDQVIGALLELGLTTEQIKTVSYTIYPQYQYVDGEQQFIGYEVRNSIQVTIYDIGVVGEVVDEAVRNGVNEVSGLSFSVKDPQAVYRLALQEALEDAVLKAMSLTSAMQVSLDPTPIEVNEQGALSDPVTPYTMTLEQSQTLTPIEPGMIEVEANLIAKFHYHS
ncbi:SIMPL domain-containing protein [Alkalibacillus haloalkaliphilus]|uniref:SIMPL domain-containing protein n=1 Tax=Alkalibacillus haloalkaliphilus TaxID=94136 RepID=UPI00031EC43D|nr:SIMPL domain-containing protein [Alkalibacillus haloalkaliphilus]